MRKVIVSLTIFLFGIMCFLYSLPPKNKMNTNFKKINKVLVLKSKREMYLMEKGVVVKTYKIALGDDPIGHKVKEGDEKTPEGMYVLDYRNDKSSCYKSIHISYPNAQDKLKAKQLNVSPGGFIMIHGLHPNIKALGKAHSLYDWTDGCIGVTNQEMDQIWNLVENGIPIEIRK